MEREAKRRNKERIRERKRERERERETRVAQAYTIKRSKKNTCTWHSTTI